MTEDDQSNATGIVLVIAIIAVPLLLALCIVFGVIGSLMLPIMLSERPLAVFDSAESDATRFNRLVLINTNDQIETISPNGDNRRVVSSSPYAYQFPSWSPDDSLIAALGTDGSESGLFVMPDSADAEPTAVFNARFTPIYHSWSPDGQKLSLIANHPRGFGLYIVPTDAADEPRLLATGQPLYWDWMAASDELFVHTGTPRNGSDQLGFVATDENGSTDSIADSGFFQAPAISASGAYAAYAQYVAGERQVVIRPIDGGDGLVVDHNKTTTFAWNPQADQLVFVAPPANDGNETFGALHYIDVATQDELILTDHQTVAFFWSPDGQKIAYLKVRFNSQSQQVSADNLIRVRQSHPSILLELWVIDMSNGAQNATRELVAVFQPNPLFLTQFLPFYDQYSRSHQLWSPTSDAIVLPIQRDAEFSVAIYPIDGSDPQIIPNAKIAFWSHH
jgi:TolB protein